MYTAPRTECLIGIDWGTTVLKAGVFSAGRGGVIARASRNLPVVNGSEQDMNAAWKLFVDVIRELRAQCGSRWKRVSGIGLAAQGGSSIVAERATGRACTRMILWNDPRGADLCLDLVRRTTPSFWRNRFQLSAPPAGLGRLLWLKREHPEWFSSKHIHVGAGEWAFHRLTGVWRQDAGNALQIGTYSPGRRRLVDSALRLAGLPLDIVAPLREGHETASLCNEAARFLDLPPGIPIAGPYIDQEAGYLSAGGACEHPLQCSLGTAWVGNFRLPENVRGSSPFQLVLPSPVDGGDLIVHPLLTGNTSWDWALSASVDAPSSERLARAARMLSKRLLPPDGLAAIPYASQQNPFGGMPGAAMFFGVGASTTCHELLRAVVAGMACEMARVFGALCANHVIDGVVLGGGASQGKAFRDWIAALFHPLPVFYQKDSTLAAARGTLHAFAPHAACAPVRLSPPCAALTPQHAARSLAYYRALHATQEHLFPLSKAFTIEEG